MRALVFRHIKIWTARLCCTLVSKGTLYVYIGYGDLKSELANSAGSFTAQFLVSTGSSCNLHHAPVMAIRMWTKIIHTEKRIWRIYRKNGALTCDVVETLPKAEPPPQHCFLILSHSHSKGRSDAFLRTNHKMRWVSATLRMVQVPAQDSSTLPPKLCKQRELWLRGQPAGKQASAKCVVVRPVHLSRIIRAQLTFRRPACSKPRITLF